MDSRNNKKTNTKALNPKRELFCRLYALDSRCIGNAAQSYLEAYGLDKSHYESSIRSGSRLLMFVEVRDRIRELMDKNLNHKDVDRELSKVIFQDKDLHAKVAGIREYNRIYGREPQEAQKTEVVFSWEDPEPRPTKQK